MIMVCDQNEPSMYLGSILLFVIILGGLDDKFVLLMDSKRSLMVKSLLYVQIMLAVFIL